MAEIAPRAATGVLTDEPALGRRAAGARRAAAGRLRLPVYAAARRGRGMNVTVLTDR